MTLLTLPEPAPRRTCSPVEAARLALEPGTVVSSPAREQVMVVAATMWCRELHMPTIRRLARQVERTPSTTLQGFDRVIHIYAEVIRREWATLQDRWYDQPHPEAVEWLADHALELANVDRALMRLPVLVHAAVREAGMCRASRDDWSRSSPLYLVAGLASTDLDLPVRDRLASRLLRAGDW